MKSYLFVIFVVAFATLLAACNNRSRGRLPSTDSSISVDSSPGDGGDSATDSTVPTDSTVTTDTSVPIDTGPGACAADIFAEGFGLIASGSTVDVGNEQAGSCGGDRAPEVIVAWTAPMSETINIDTMGSDYDTMLYVRRGECTGMEAGCDDDAIAPQSRVTVAVMAGETLYIFVDGFGDNQGNFMLNINAGVP